MNEDRPSEDAAASVRPVPTPPKHPLTQPIPVVQTPKRRRRRARRRRKRLPLKAIVFVGPMAAGKTSLGRQVAKELGVPFVDTDAVFVRGHGPITEFFATHGEEEFRRIEAEVIAEELARPGTRIVALGGGAVLTDSTRALLHQHPVVLLMTTQEAVLRTANLARRPLLRDDPDAWGRILEARRHLYEEVADVTYRTDRATKEQLTRRVAEWVRGYGTRRQEQP
ncbi:MAG: shikimate kinase [Leucobacter sp.]